MTSDMSQAISRGLALKVSCDGSFAERTLSHLQAAGVPQGIEDRRRTSDGNMTPLRPAEGALGVGARGIAGNQARRAGARLAKSRRLPDVQRSICRFRRYPWLLGDCEEDE